MTIPIPIDDVLPWLQTSAVWLGLVAWYLVAYFVVRIWARRENWETLVQVVAWVLSPLLFPLAVIFRGTGWSADILFPDET